jgi:hypothetical protein
MPFTFEEVGGIAIPYPTADERDIQRALSNLDPGLFLDKEWDPEFGYAYHVVKHRVGENLVLPVAGTEWRNEHGPKPLSMAIVDRVRRNENALEGAAEWAVSRNREIQQRARDDASERMDDVIRDFDRHGRTGNFAGPIHRSQRLRLARDRARRKGL